MSLEKNLQKAVGKLTSEPRSSYFPFKFCMVALSHRAIGTLSRPSAPIVTGGRAILKTNEIFLNETLLSP